MLADRRAKIVATIGPSTESKESLKEAIESGLNVARLNFSHGQHADHLKSIESIRELSKELKAPVGILQDLQGPKIRVGELENGEIELVSGSEVIITTEKIIGKKGVISTDFSELPQSCKLGSKILLDDGLMELKVKSVDAPHVICEVIFGGTLKSRKGMNLPGAHLPMNCLTEKDLKDLQFGLDQGVDYIALSFVRRAEDMKKLREIVEQKTSDIKLVAKIEMLEAIEHLEEIVKVSDAVMVARGDLAVEVGQSQLPVIQKRIITLCNNLDKPVITATQMLDSMVENPRPTRAEITDVANAVIDGSDALMLSAETASGKYPFKCIQTMHEIILEVEKSGDYYYDIAFDNEECLTVPASIAASACLSALKLETTAIVCLTTSGKTVTMISSYRPKARVIAVTDYIGTLNRLELAWGIQTFAINKYNSTDEAIEQIETLLLQYKLVQPGENVILTLGMPVEEKAKTNSIMVYTIKDRSVDEVSLPLRCRNNSD